jgi:hypothetical protein
MVSLGICLPAFAIIAIVASSASFATWWWIADCRRC